jgi:uncharacterized protein
MHVVAWQLKQEGLLHISEMAETRVTDVHSVVKPGDVVRVRVTRVEPQRNRISLSLRNLDAAPPMESPEVIDLTS